jgi:multiple sugar transport system ATP-binding protein
VYVTHDQVEAMTLGDRVAVLRGGVLQQVGTPEQLFERPANLFVAAFIGSPAMNIVEATVEDGEARFGGWRIPLPRRSPLRTAPGGRLALGIRPHDLAIAGDEALPRLRARIEVVERLGTETHLVFGVDAARVRTDELRDAVDATEATDDVLLAEDEDRALFTAVVGAHARVSVGDEIDLVADPERLYGFDLATGQALGREGEREPAPAPVAA